MYGHVRVCLYNLWPKIHHWVLFGGDRWRPPHLEPLSFWIWCSDLGRIHCSAWLHTIPLIFNVLYAHMCVGICILCIYDIIWLYTYIYIYVYDYIYIYICVYDQAKVEGGKKDTKLPNLFVISLLVSSWRLWPHRVPLKRLESLRTSMASAVNFWAP